MRCKVSVVVPTYKRPDLLQRCLEALSVQHFDSYEVIVVSDGYDELAKKVTDDQAGRFDVRYCPLDLKRGPAAARNHGWRNAKGILVTFTDDDCVPDKYWLKEFWDQYRNEECIAFTGNIKVPLPEEPTDFDRMTHGLEKAGFVTANCCVSKKALEITGGFDEDFSMAWREDTELEFKLIRFNVPIVYNVNALVIHPVRKATWGVSIKEQKKNVYNALLFKKYPDLYRERVQEKPRRDYYVIVLSVLLFIVAAAKSEYITAYAALTVWCLFTLRFIKQRLTGTSRRIHHVTEMVVTSVVIPFASVYWRIYGAVKYRVGYL